MTEHVHEWMIKQDYKAMKFAECNICDERMWVMEINRRLNEYETLKRATEALSAKAYIRGAVDYCHRESLVRADIDVPDDLCADILKDG